MGRGNARSRPGGAGELPGRHRLGALALAAWFASLGVARTAHADNPIVQHAYTADPAPLVHGDTVYLYTSHDEDVTVDNFFTMNDWFVFSSKDMVNWTDHGSPLGYDSFNWASGDAWAGQCIHRNGKFYWYVPVTTPGTAIGVAVSDSPTGPFIDALGKPLVQGGGYIDPTVFIDDGGQAYLYWGNPGLHYVKLNEDMISFSGSVVDVPLTTASFGVRSAADRATAYEEGPWFFRRESKYFMVFAADGIPEDIAYSTSSSPTGPWSYQGVIMDTQTGAAFTNHAGVIDFKGRSFFFYHTQGLPGGGGFKRSTAIEEFSYTADGKFPNIDMTTAGVSDSVEPLGPYVRVEGETMAWGSGVEVEDCSEGGRDLASIQNGDYVKVESVDFSTGAISFAASVASATAGGTIELHLDALDGALVGTCVVPGTGGWQTWQTVTCAVSGASQVHDLYLVFTGAEGFLFNVDWWQFTPKDPPPTGSGGTSSSPGGADGLDDGGGTPPFAGGAGSDGSEGGDDPAGCACSTAPGSGRSAQTPSVLGWLALGLLTLVGRTRQRQRAASR